MEEVFLLCVSLQIIQLQRSLQLLSSTSTPGLVPSILLCLLFQVPALWLHAVLPASGVQAACCPIPSTETLQRAAVSGTSSLTFSTRLSRRY